MDTSSNLEHRSTSFEPNRQFVASPFEDELDSKSIWQPKQESIGEDQDQREHEPGGRMEEAGGSERWFDLLHK